MTSKLLLIALALLITPLANAVDYCRISRTDTYVGIYPGSSERPLSIHISDAPAAGYHEVTNVEQDGRVFIAKKRGGGEVILDFVNRQLSIDGEDPLKLVDCKHTGSE